MTHFQYGTMKYVLNHDLTVDDARSISMVTFGSLVKRGWLERHGNKLRITEAGFEAFNQYHRAQANFRKNEADLSDRVKTMLHIQDLTIVTRRKAS